MKQLPPSLLVAIMSTAQALQDKGGGDQDGDVSGPLLLKFQTLDEAQASGLEGARATASAILAKSPSICGLTITTENSPCFPDMATELKEVIAENKLALRLLCETVHLTDPR